MQATLLAVTFRLKSVSARSLDWCKDLKQTGKAPGLDSQSSPRLRLFLPSHNVEEQHCLTCLCLFGGLSCFSIINSTSLYTPPLQTKRTTRYQIWFYMFSPRKKKSCPPRKPSKHGCLWRLRPAAAVDDVPRLPSWVNIAGTTGCKTRVKTTDVGW